MLMCNHLCWCLHLLDTAVSCILEELGRSFLIASCQVSHISPSGHTACKCTPVAYRHILAGDVLWNAVQRERSTLNAATGSEECTMVSQTISASCLWYCCKVAFVQLPMAAAGPLALSTGDYHKSVSNMVNHACQLQKDLFRPVQPRSERKLCSFMLLVQT